MIGQKNIFSSDKFNREVCYSNCLASMIPMYTNLIKIVLYNFRNTIIHPKYLKNKYNTNLSIRHTKTELCDI